MSKFFLVHDTARRMALKAVQEAPDGFVVEIKARTRSLSQNALLHALLDDLSAQIEWYGQKLGREDWKRMCAASLQGVRVVPGIDAGTFVPIGMRTRDMTTGEMNEMIEFIYALGAKHGVVFHERVAA